MNPPVIAVLSSMLVALASWPAAPLAAPAPGDADLAVRDSAPRPHRPPVELRRTRLAQADPDADGRVTPEEASRFFERHFVSLDRNRDRALDEGEFLRLAGSAVTRTPIRPALVGRAADEFDKLDRNDDGRLSYDEFMHRQPDPAGERTRWTRQRVERLFHRLAPEGDGMITWAAFMATGRSYYGHCVRVDGHVPVARFLAGLPF